MFQGTVDINIGPDRLAGPKALDPQSLQSTNNPLIAQPLCLEVLTVHGTKMRLFGAKALPLLIL